MLFRTRYNVLFRQFRLLTAQAGSIPAAIRLIFENCYKTHFAGAPAQRKIPGGYPLRRVSAAHFFRVAMS